MTRLGLGLSGTSASMSFILGEAPNPSHGLQEHARVWWPKEGERFRDVLSRYCSAHHSNETVLLGFRTTDYADLVKIGKMQAGRSHAVFLTTGAFLEPRLRFGNQGFWKALKARWRLHAKWRHADGVIAVSPEVAADWRVYGRFPGDRVYAPPPPVLGPDTICKSLEPVKDDWFVASDHPVIVGVGRLQSDKRYDLLIEALPYVLRREPARLALIGDGPERENLIRLVRHLHLDEFVRFAGYSDNPYAWMRKAAVLVQPSRVETFGFALIEALGCGTPFVATREPPGPRSIQNATGFGTLVPGGNPKALAQGIVSALGQSTPEEQLIESVSAYNLENSISAYREILGV